MYIPRRLAPPASLASVLALASFRPISLLRLSMLRFTDSKSRNCLRTRIRPLKSQILLEPNLLKSRIVVQRLAALCSTVRSGHCASVCSVACARVCAIALQCSKYICWITF